MEINPADLPTRGMTASELLQSNMWMEGPEFLRQNEFTWPAKLPENPAIQNTECGHRKKLTFATVTNSEC